MQAVRETAPFTVLSSPSHDPGCPAGKVSWLHSHLGSHFRDFLIGHQKFLCAKHDVVLIDDSDHNVEQFRAHGGQAILFPQIWNSNHAIQDRLGYTNAELLKLLD